MAGIGADSHVSQMVVIRGPRKGGLIVGGASIAVATVDTSAFANDGVTIEVHAQGGDLFVLLGNVAGDVAAMDPAATGLLGTDTLCARIPVDQSKRFLVGPRDLVMGIRTSAGTATYRIEANSDGDKHTMVSKIVQP